MSGGTSLMSPRSAGFWALFNWVRDHFPEEVQAVLPRLNAALKNDATFPLSGEQLRAKRAIQRLACQCIELAAIDMVGLVSGDRPGIVLSSPAGQGEKKKLATGNRQIA